MNMEFEGLLWSSTVIQASKHSTIITASTLTITRQSYVRLLQSREAKEVTDG